MLFAIATGHACLPAADACRMRQRMADAASASKLKPASRRLVQKSDVIGDCGACWRTDAAAPAGREGWQALSPGKVGWRRAHSPALPPCPPTRKAARAAQRSASTLAGHQRQTFPDPPAMQTSCTPPLLTWPARAAAPGGGECRGPWAARRCRPGCPAPSPAPHKEEWNCQVSAAVQGNSWEVR